MDIRKNRIGMLIVIIMALVMGVAFSGVLTPSSAAGKTYTISPKSKPLDKKMMNYSFYNKYTRQYYTIRSYMERFEKKGGGTLILKKGTYTVTNTIFVPSNVTIQLQDGAVIKKGTNTHLSKMKASRSLFHFIKPSKGQKKSVYGKYNGEKNISIIGNGNAVINMSSQKDSNCIEAGHNKGILITGITFKNCKGGHFMELDASKNVSISDCKFVNIKDSKNVREAINMDTPDKKTGGFTAAWSKFDCTANQNVTIERCVFKDMPRAIGTHNYSGGHPHKNITIRDCNIENVRSFGIGMMYWKGAEITGCTIKGKYKKGKGEFDGILGFGVQSVDIIGNHIENFRYPMLFKDYQERYAKIYNQFSENELEQLGQNTGSGLSNTFALVRNNNRGTDQAKIPIDTVD